MQQFSKNKFAAVCLEKLRNCVNRMTFKFTPTSFNGNFGVTFNVKGTNNRLGSAVVAFDAVNSTVACYNNVSNVIRYGNALASVPFAYQIGKEYTVNMIIEEELITIYLDNSVALTARLPGIENKNFGFYSNGVEVMFKEMNFYV